MNNEIKEILDKLKVHKEYYKNETKRLGKLFYITKEENIKLQERIEKAVEYMKNNDNFWVALGEDCGKPNDDLDKLLNILNGRSDE